MKTPHDMIAEQRSEVDRYRKVAENAVLQLCSPNEAIVGVLLSGSTARGDARKGPFRFMIDLIVVANDRGSVGLEKVFGPNTEPSMPYHCVSFQEVGLQIDLATIDELKAIRSRNESEMFAKQEALMHRMQTRRVRPTAIFYIA